MTFGRVNSLTGTGNDVRFLQIDVPIQPGNSGGSLLSTHWGSCGYRLGHFEPGSGLPIGRVIIIPIFVGLSL